MASLIEDHGKTGTTWRLQVMIDGQRRTLRPGKLPKRQAESVLRHVEALASSRIDRSAPS